MGQIRFLGFGGGFPYYLRLARFRRGRAGVRKLLSGRRWIENSDYRTGLLSVGKGRCGALADWWGLDLR